MGERFRRTVEHAQGLFSVPHWFGGTGDGPAELLSIFGHPGERMQVRSAGGDEPQPHQDPHE